MKKNYLVKFTHIDGKIAEYRVKAKNRHWALIDADDLLFVNHGWTSEVINDVKCTDLEGNHSE